MPRTGRIVGIQFTPEQETKVAELGAWLNQMTDHPRIWTFSEVIRYCLEQIHANQKLVHKTHAHRS
jgi:hypothetical protein